MTSDDTRLAAIRQLLAPLRQLWTDLNRGASIPNLAEQIWDQADAISIQLDAQAQTIATLRQERDEALAWKEDALLSLADWHRLGQTLLEIAPAQIGDTLPRHLDTAIPQKIQQLEARLTRLTEGLRALSDRHAGWEHGCGPCICEPHLTACALLADPEGG